MQYQVVSLKTQSAEAIKGLLAWKKVASDPLPEFVEMGEGDNRLVLVLSNKKDAYYTVTAKSCSCPAATYHPGTRCKHQRKYFPQPKKSREELEAEGEAILEAHHNTAKRLARPPESSSIRDNLPGWSGGHNGPVEAWGFLPSGTTFFRARCGTMSWWAIKWEKIRAIQEGRLEEAKEAIAQIRAQAREYLEAEGT